VTSKSYTVEDRHDDDDTMADTTFLLAITARCGEVKVTTVVAGGDGIAHNKLGPWGEVHLHRTLTIPMKAVGPSGLDLEAAAFGPLQPPSVGPDWEPPRLTLDTFGSFPTHTADNTYDGYHRLLELPQTESAKQPASFTSVFVSMEEGRKDWELPPLPSDALASIFSAHTTNTLASYHGQLELLTVESTKQPVSCTRVLVSLEEGKIVGTDVRRQKSRLTSPVCTAVTRSLQPAG